MDKIDLKSIQYIPQEETVENENENIKDDENIGKIIKNAQKLKTEIKKENKIIDEKNNDDKQMDKQRLILILRFYVLEFKDRLSEYKKTKFEKMSVEQLQELRKQFDSIISSKSSLKQTQGLIINGIKTIETIATMFTPIQCQGLSNLMINDTDVLDDIKHISLKHMAMVQVEPEYRLLYKMFSNIMLLHNVNSIQGSIKEKSNNFNKLNQLNKKYNDL